MALNKAIFWRDELRIPFQSLNQAYALSMELEDSITEKDYTNEFNLLFNLLLSGHNLKNQNYSYEDNTNEKKLQKD